MDSPSVLTRPDVTVATTAPRPTPPPAQTKFAQVLATGARGIVRGADQAVSVLPGGPLMAVALRSGASVTAPTPTIMAPLMPSAPQAGAPASLPAASTVPEGPSASATSGAASGVASALGGDGGVEGAMAQSQEMNLYFLQIQQQVNAQDRAYTAYSNVLKAEHDTVMTAVGNIR